MLTAEQVASFETFGFLFFRQVFSREEMERITCAAEEVWEKCLGHRAGEDEAVSMGTFIEGQPELERLAEDSRVYDAAAHVMGSDLIWSGSEGNRGIRAGDDIHQWHADREGEKELDYLRVKFMLYLDPMRKETGALRVIPGSHRMPLHEDLASFRDRYDEDNPLFFGVEGPNVPCHAVETVPGDLLMFNQSLYHAVYGKRDRRRRYIALKYAARPTTDAHIVSNKQWSPGIFEPNEAFLNSDRPRIRGLVEGLVELGRI